jgi:pyrroloquinoline quinone biosynthesis protein B
VNTRLKLSERDVTAVVLGIMQDGGLPHIGCRCHRCTAAYHDPNLTRLTTCLGIVDNRRRPAKVWLIDASPDIKFQLDILGDILGPDPQMPGRFRQPDGIFLTHSHMGHTAGLVQLGPEGMNVQNLPVFASEKLITLIQGTRLWQPLVKNLAFIPMASGNSIKLAPELAITPIAVVHRDEVAGGTFAYLCSGPSCTLLYLPDIDSWKSFDKTRVALGKVDIALVDASFFSREELGSRSSVAHPLVTDTLEYWAGSSSRLILTHINHTNPILDQGSAAQLVVDEAGGSVAFTGQLIPL